MLLYLDSYGGILEQKFATKTLQKALRYLFNYMITPKKNIIGFSKGYVSPTRHNYPLPP